MRTDIGFLASILHEIRTPIQTVLGTVELLQETKLDTEQAEYVRQIAFSADVLYTLANDILDMEKIRTGNLHIENIPYSIQQIPEQVMDLISIEAYNKGLELIIETTNTVPEIICGDPVRIQQVLLNIVKNAVKFTAKGSISIFIDTGIENGQRQLEVFVKDTGIGVPDDMKHRIFEEFVQATDSTARKFGGTGLGLSICTKLVALMNGSIGIEDNPGGGTVFWFKIPMLDCQQEQQIQPVPLPDGIRILIVAHNTLFRDSLKRTLQQLGVIHTDTAASGTEALEKLLQAAINHQEYTAALIDMTLPVMDGWRLSAHINEDRTINGVKLYLMIPEGQLGGEAKMKMLAWFNGYLYKPVKKHKLKEIIHDIITKPLELPAVGDDFQETARAHPLPATAPHIWDTAATLQQKNSGQQPYTAENSGAGLCSVLAVDDHPVNLTIMKTFLTGFHLTVYTAVNGTEAIQTIQEHPEISLVFMDIQMPDMTGMDATKQIRQNGYTGTIVACSANSDPEMEDIYAESGMNDVLVKPFKKQHLFELVQKWNIRSQHQ